MENDQFAPDWGKGWTYLVLALVFASITAFIWYLVEERRDADSTAFYSAAKANQEQLEALQAYAWADSSNCVERVAIKAMLRQIHIIRTRREADSLAHVRDSLALVALQAPKLDTIVVTAGKTSARLTWSLDKPSQGLIRYGTASGVYKDSTALEASYLTSHTQAVGYDRPLAQGTRYFYQVFIKGEASSPAYSQERTFVTGQYIEKLYLVDATNHKILREIRNGDKIPASLVSGILCTVQAEAPDPAVISFQFAISGALTQATRTEGTRPWTAFGDNATAKTYAGKTFPVGSYAVKMTALDLPKAVLQTRTINFSITP